MDKLNSPTVTRGVVEVLDAVAPVYVDDVARELELRREIMLAFAATGEPPEVTDAATLSELERAHVVVLRNGRIHMAHPFAAHREGTRVDSAGRTWWGNCAWDGLGIVAALGLDEATVTSGAATLRVSGGQARQDEPHFFEVAVPAGHWWDDIEHT